MFRTLCCRLLRTVAACSTVACLTHTAPCLAQRLPATDQQAPQTQLSAKQVWDIVRTLRDRPGYARPYDVNWEMGFSEGLGEVEINGKWGFIDANGKIVVPAQYDQAMPFRSGLAPVRAGALTNRSSKEAVFRLAGSWRWVNRDGQQLCKGKYLICGSFSEGLAMVSPDGWKCGFVTPDGELAIPATYLSAGDFSEGLAVVRNEQHLEGYINARGTMVIPARFLSAGPFNRGRAVVRERDGYKIIDTTGAQLALLPYEQLQEFRFGEGMLPVAKDGRWGFVNDAGQQVMACDFEWVDPFHESLAAAARGGKIGFIDRQGKFVIQPQFDLVLPLDGANRPFHPEPCNFSEGLAAVPKDGKWGYISRNGEWVIQPQFDKAGPFTDGAAKVAVNNRLGYIDRMGKYIWEPTR